VKLIVAPLESVSLNLAPVPVKSKMKINQDKYGWEIDFFDVESNSAERYGGKKRSELKDSDFMDPKRRSFPVMSCQDVSDAVSAWGRYTGSMTFEEFKAKLTRRAKSLGCEASLPAKWKEESKSAEMTKKQWDKVDKKELKRDSKKEKGEHEKDAIEDDEDKIKKLKKGKPSEKKSVMVHDLKKDERFDKKDAKKESEGASDKQKAAQDRFKEMIQKKKKGPKDSDDKKDDKKDGKKEEGKDDKKLPSWLKKKKGDSKDSK